MKQNEDKLGLRCAMERKRAQWWQRGSERAESGNAIQEGALINEATPVRNLLRCWDVCSLQVPSASNTPLPALNTGSIRSDGASSSSAADSTTERRQRSLEKQFVFISVVFFCEGITSLFFWPIGGTVHNLFYPNQMFYWQGKHISRHVALRKLAIRALEGRRNNVLQYINVQKWCRPSLVGWFASDTRQKWTEVPEIV